MGTGLNEWTNLWKHRLRFAHMAREANSGTMWRVRFDLVNGSRNMKSKKTNPKFHILMLRKKKTKTRTRDSSEQLIVRKAKTKDEWPWKVRSAVFWCRRASIYICRCLITIYLYIYCVFLIELTRNVLWQIDQSYYLFILSWTIQFIGEHHANK